MSRILFYPDKTVDNIRGWYWLESDTGAWDGPKQDWEESHKPKLLELRNRFDIKGRVAVQAGGNQGMYAKLLSKLYDWVYTFEPDMLNHRVLCQNCISDNIIVIQGALGNQDGAFVNVSQRNMKNTGMHTVSISQNGNVPLLMLDSFNFSDVGLLMLDLEGFEECAIHGAIKTIINNDLLLFCERPNTELIELLKMYGYTRVYQSKMDTIFYKM